MADFYSTLGVSPMAPAEDIKQAYRKKARELHPDRNKAAGAEARFKSVQAAYDVLKDPQKRRFYDQCGDRWEQASRANAAGRGAQGTAWGGARRRRGGGVEGIFSDLLGGADDARHAPINRDEQATILLTLDQVYQGGAQTMRLGSRNLRVRVPAGIAEGKKIRLAGQARSGGDLYLSVQYAPHALFRVQGRDVHIDLPVSPWEAALGVKAPVDTLGGVVDMNIPAGSQTGAKLRMRGRGLPAGDQSGAAGDQFVHLKIMNPKMDDPALLDAYRQLSRLSRFNPRA